jgi:hypothetical protein
MRIWQRFYTWCTRPTPTEMDRLLVRRRLEDVLADLERDAVQRLRGLGI